MVFLTISMAFVFILLIFNKYPIASTSSYATVNVCLALYYTCVTQRQERIMSEVKR